MKKCTKCKISKVEEEFYFDKNNNRHYSKCFVCQRQKAKEYRESHKDIIKSRENSKRSRSKRREYNRELIKTIDNTSILKVCCRCKKEKNLNSFYRDITGVYGRKALCISCKSQEVKKTYNKEEERLKKIKKKYNIPEEQYFKLVELQNNKCCICNNEGTQNINGNLYVDHNHTTGKIRGLLCSYCNTGIGMFKDNEELLFKAIEYLKKDKNVN